ncbi:MAG: hypothetical protein AAGF11_08590 [Myxococcota bacterium]
MAKRTARRARKQQKRDEALLERALRRSDAVEVLELAARVSSVPDPSVVAQIFARDVAASRRRKDSARLLRLAKGLADGLADLRLLPEPEATTCRWIMLGPCVEYDLRTSLRRLSDALGPTLEQRAPQLRPWLGAAAVHGQWIPPEHADELPYLCEPLRPSWDFPQPLETADAFRQAVLASSFVLHPQKLEEPITRHLEHLSHAARQAHAAAALPAIRLRTLEAAIAEDLDALRTGLNLIARLSTHHRDPDTLGLAIRLCNRLSPRSQRQNLHCLGRLLDVASGDRNVRTLAQAAFISLEPQPWLRADAVAIAGRMHKRASNVAVWGHAFELWYDDLDEDRPSWEGVPPPWIARAYDTALHRGTLLEWLMSLDERRRIAFVHKLEALPWKRLLDVVEQLWDRASAVEQAQLATAVVHCLEFRELELPTIRWSTTPTVEQLRQRVIQFKDQQWPNVPESLLDFIDELNAMPPLMLVPGPLLDMVELAMAEHVAEGFGPRQRAFIESHGMRVVPRSMEVLHLILHEPEYLEDGVRWVEAYLGEQPSNTEIVGVARMIWAHEWPTLDRYMQRRIEQRAQWCVDDLVELFEAMLHLTNYPPALGTTLIDRLVDACQRGELQYGALVGMVQRCLPPELQHEADDYGSTIEEAERSQTVAEATK